MCYPKGKSRKQCYFHITPPEDGEYLLKVYAKPEEDIMTESDTLDHVATFPIIADQVQGPKAKSSPPCLFFIIRLL